MFNYTTHYYKSINCIYDIFDTPCLVICTKCVHKYLDFVIMTAQKSSSELVSESNSYFLLFLRITTGNLMTTVILNQTIFFYPENQRTSPSKTLGCKDIVYENLNTLNEMD